MLLRDCKERVNKNLHELPIKHFMESKIHTMKHIAFLFQQLVNMDILELLFVTSHVQ